VLVACCRQVSQGTVPASAAASGRGGEGVQSGVGNVSSSNDRVLEIAQQ
jgi:hypothetical protein